MLAKALALKVAAATIGLGVAAGGVAVAATGGAGTTTGLGKGRQAAGGQPTGKPTKPANRSRAAKGNGPSPSLVGLCRAYAAGAGDNPGKALENPAFTALLTAAGGAAEVPAFCADVLAAKEAAKPTAAPTGKADKPRKAHPTPAHPVPDKPKGGPQPKSPAP